MEHITLEDAQKIVDKRDRLDKLVNDDLFKEFFLEGYFRDEAARLAQAITNPNMMDDIDQREIEGQFRAIGHIQNYILTIKQKGDANAAAIAEHHEKEHEAMVASEKTMEIDPITGDEYEVGED